MTSDKRMSDDNDGEPRRPQAPRPQECGDEEMSALDLRTERPEGMGIGTSFTAKRGQSWQWDGRERWWEVVTTITGYNGAGGYWITENWRWNGGSKFLRDDICSLTAEQSRDLDAQYAAALSAKENT